MSLTQARWVIRSDPTLSRESLDYFEPESKSIDNLAGDFHRPLDGLMAVDTLTLQTLGWATQVIESAPWMHQRFKRIRCAVGHDGSHFSERFTRVSEMLRRGAQPTPSGPSRRFPFCTPSSSTHSARDLIHEHVGAVRRVSESTGVPGYRAQ